MYFTKDSLTCCLALGKPVLRHDGLFCVATDPSTNGDTINHALIIGNYISGASDGRLHVIRMQRVNGHGLVFLYSLTWPIADLGFKVAHVVVCRIGPGTRLKNNAVAFIQTK